MFPSADSIDKNLRSSAFARGYGGLGKADDAAFIASTLNPDMSEPLYGASLEPPPGQGFRLQSRPDFRERLDLKTAVLAAVLPAPQEGRALSGDFGFRI